MRHIIALVGLLTLSLAACTPELPPTPDLFATQIAVEKAAHAT